jgi:hypothetical protein
MSSPVDESLQAPVLKYGEVFWLGLQTTIRSQSPAFFVVVATAMREPSAAISLTGCFVLSTRLAPVEGDAAAGSEPTASRAAIASQETFTTSVSHPCRSRGNEVKVRRRR